MLNTILEEEFPNLQASGYRITSPESNAYNCVAWAIGDVVHWWWPIHDEGYFWPSDLPLGEMLENFIRAFGSFGYRISENDAFEPGFEKIAIYVDEHGMPTHVARQLSADKWTSKLGWSVDIEHNTLLALTGSEYGQVGVILRRTSVEAGG